ncbi:hypothetical protein VUJ46_20055 [Chryseobacterium sp. MYb264]|uniref:hypothetical protein n=1 Tax=Chryseobacterium sp. MYb264 TaxID=2745153 RepID=UPI002E10CBEC|nr:hypothetical protein VUJ46_20055 [Chryseobacterium sp. MYb264]
MLIVFVMMLTFACDKKTDNKPKKIVNELFKFSLCYFDTHGEYHDEDFAQNDSIFYQSGRGFFYKKGTRYPVSNKLTFEEVIKKYNLKKLDTKVFTDGSNYKTQFTYEDCLTNKIVKSDSGQVTTIKSKDGVIFQYINILNQPIILQIKSNVNKYKIPIELEMQTTEQIFRKGFGYSHAMLYDIDRDGKDELLIVYNSECVNIIAYKINDGI